jgi:hypothetical protein
VSSPSRRRRACRESRSALGDIDRALDALEDAYEQRDPTLLAMTAVPLLARLRSQPRFEALMARLAAHRRTFGQPAQEPPHKGAVVRVQMTRSIVRSPGAANGVFAINLASHSQIILDVESNVVGGGLNSPGGAGMPTNAVTGAGVIIRSSHNLYRSDSPLPTPMGWFLFGGSDTPSAVVASQATTFNTLQMHSIDDTLVGFATGIAAIGGRRFNALSEPISSNRVELNLYGTLLQTTTVDLRLLGATTMLGVSPGDDNTAHVLLVHATGSGARANRYAHSSTPPMGSPGIGNRLEIVGNANAFDQINQNFVPPPPAEFFIGGDGWSATSFLRYSLTTRVFIGRQEGRGTLVLGESGDEFTTEDSRLLRRARP